MSELMTADDGQVRTIYCDEAGYTGNNLMSEDQPYFVYSSTVIDHEEAKEVVARVFRDYRIQGNEIKGSNLVKSKNGQKAAIWILREYAENSCVVFFDKKYALAGKFFEYIFEPVLVRQSSLFYATHFHRFISTFLYLEFLVREDYAEEILSEFEVAMRAKDFDQLEHLFTSAGSDPQMSRFLRHILTFTICHKDSIVEELNSLKKYEQIGNWVLELSLTALHLLLAKWSETIDSMQVYCARSQPLGVQSPIMDTMIDRTD